MTADPDCPLCLGAGGWEDPKEQQSVACPACFPVKPKSAIWPARIEAYDFLQAAHQGPLFPSPPRLVVLHRPAAANCAEYLHDTPDGRVVSVHFAASRITGVYLQLLNLHRQAYGAGGSSWEQWKRLNPTAIQIECCRPMAQRWSSSDTAQTRELLERLDEAIPTLVACLGHGDGGDPNRTDPGRDFPWEDVLAGRSWRCPHLAA